MPKQLMRLTGILLVCLTYFPQSVFSQKLNEDSISQVIKNSSYDSAKVDALLSLANYQIKNKKDDSLAFSILRDAKKLSDKINYLQGKLQILLITGNYHRSKNNWANSLDAYFEIVRNSEKSIDTSILKIRMMAFNNLGNIFNFNGDYNGSLSYRLKALEIAELLPPGNYSGLGIILLNITSDYRKLNTTSKAIYYLQQATAIYPHLPERLKMEYYYEYYENLAESDSSGQAYSMLDSMEAGLRKFNLSPYQRNDFNQMYFKEKGLYLLNTKKDRDAELDYFTQSLQLARKLGNGPEITSALFNLGLVYVEFNKTNMAIRLFQESYDSSVSQSLKNSTLKAARQLAENWLKSGNSGLAAGFLKKALDLQQQIYDEEKNKQLNFLEALYQSEKKEKEIASLRLLNTENELLIVKRNRLLLVGGILASALLLILILLYRTTWQKKKLAENEKKIQQDQISFLERQQQVVSLQSMINGQETERTRIAKDLHDGLSGMFSTVKMYFSTLQHEKEDLKQNFTFKKSVELIDSAAEEIRRIAHNMMPEVLMKLGLVHSIQDMCSNISAGKLLQVQLLSYGMEKRLNASTEIMLYRIIQELLNNIMKHAQASEAIIQFNRSDNRLIVTVEDNGRGFSTAENDNRKHAGLDTIKSRVDYLNGNITIDSQKEIGTTVVMEFLINEEI